MGLFDSFRSGSKGGKGAPPGQPAASPPAPPARTGTPPAPGWAPRIDAEACRACGTCLDECPTGVFSLGRHDRRARITHPEACESHCDRCATHCPEEGISFPGRGVEP